MGAHMSLLVAAGEFLPRWVRAIGLKAEDLDSLVYSFGPNANVNSTENVEDEKVEQVLSRVSCKRDMAVNALLSTGNDVDSAVSFLQSFAEEDIVTEISGMNLNQSSVETDKTKHLDEVSTESSCPPVCKALPSGKVWNDPTTSSEVPSSRSYAPSSIQFGKATSQFDPEPGSSTTSSQDDTTELFLACRTGLVESVKSIVGRGSINLNKERYLGRDSSITNKRIRGDMKCYNATPLMIACHAGHLRVVKEILSCENADANQRNEEGTTALHVASEQGHLAIVRMLINDYHAEVEAKDRYQKTLLHFAARGGNLEMVRMLINDFHAEVEAKDKWQTTPLHFAALGGNIEMVKMLINDFHAQVDAKDYVKRTPLHLAAEYGHLEMVRMLVNDFHAQVGAKDTWQRTPLHYAAQKGHLEMVRMLINDFHAQVDAKDGEHRTPLVLAERYGKTKVVEFLRSVTQESQTEHMPSDSSVTNAENNQTKTNNKRCDVM